MKYVDKEKGEAVLDGKLQRFSVSRCCQYDQFEIRVPAGNGAHDVIHHGGIGQHGVIERSVRLNKSHPAAVRASNAI